MSIGAAFALVIFPPACGMTLLVSEQAFATRAMRKAVEQGSSLPVCLSICVQRAALKTPPHPFSVNSTLFAILGSDLYISKL